LVLLAALVCALGSLALFILLRRAFDSVERRRKQWIAVAAVAAGICVWSTHFIAMLAYQGSLAFYFDAVQTVASAALAIGFFWLAFNLLDRRGSRWRAIAAGLAATAGVTSMHFMGMAAIVAPATIAYAPLPIVVSIISSSVAFSAAFLLFFATRGWRQLVLPGLAMIAGIVVLHFSVMTYTMLLPTPGAASEAIVQDSRHWLISAVVGSTMGLLIMVLAGATVDRLLTDLQGLAEATLEGLMIVSGEEIVEANGRACALIGARPAAVIGSSPEDWFESLDDTPIAGPRGKPAEALVPGGRIVEIASHTIEYRGKPCQVLALRDLTERKRAQQAVEYLASHDSLTDLSNRAALDQRLATACHSETCFALIAVDLDRFKAVNDLFGHAAGDEILRRVADILRKAAGPEDVVARIGGDEFVIVQAGVENIEQTKQMTARIMAGFAAEMDLARDPRAVGVSLGVAMFPADGRDGETLRHNADIALYRAKREGRGTACFFDREMDQAARERRQIEHDLRHAITRNQLDLAFQPLVATRCGSLVGYEALVRWHHPDRGELAPDKFVPIAEEVGSIVPIGEWVLREACRHAARWPEHLTIAVNVSPVQFRVPSIVQTVCSALAESGLAPGRLELEITESVLLSHREATLAALHQLKGLGVRIVMDDFGTGYSSLSNLQSFPFDKLKIDRSFVAAMGDDHAARSIVRAIMALSRSLNLTAVAEGVETEAQRRMVLEEGCLQAQGYLFGEPMRSLDLFPPWREPAGPPNSSRQQRFG
jgi:diguanylate cyclase (GGDEF)-like protein